MEQAVRPMSPADGPAVAQLEAEARLALTEQRGGPAHLAERPAVGDWSALVSAPGNLVWVATIDDVVIGYLQLQLRGTAAEVLQVYVHPQAREVGFGDWLLEAALAAARAHGCTVLEGTALPGDRDTKNLYERAGIKARKITVSTPL
jgi:ribosomal protein S18 acetylase RimI-like enzyme